MSTFKILVCCHKETERLHDEIFTPILLGAEYADDKLKQAFKDDFWDNTGDNIGRLHPYCAELTAIYWAWKNYDRLGNPDYIGLHHYRRFLNYSNPLNESDNWKCAFFDFDTSTRTRFGWDRETIDRFCDGEDLILPYIEQILDPYDWKTPVNLETHYKHSHIPQDLDTAAALIKKVHPDYSDAVDEALKSGYGHFCNMFLMTRELFFDYAEWLFSIILPLETILPVTDKKYVDAQKRVLGFLGERLFNIWITKQTAEGVKLRETQRLTGYLSEAEKAHFQKTYGIDEFSRAFSHSKRFGTRNLLFLKESDSEAVVHPARTQEFPAVSILVPVYNVAEYLRECCESLVHQTLKNIEIIFVDNASTDDSLEILKEYYAKDPRIVLVEHKKNEGLPSSRNTAMRYARGEYFSYVDSDDVCDLTMFEKLYRKAEALSADIVTCCVFGFFDSIQERYYHRPLEWFGDSDRLLSLKGRPQQLMEPAAWCKLFRTEYIKGLDYFEFREKTRAWEDVPAMTSAFCQTDRIATVQEGLYFYRQRREGNMSSNMTRQHVDEFVSGALLQQSILDRHHFFDEGVQSYIEEFKLLYAEWSLTKMRKSDIPYFFRRVPSLFRRENKKYLERVFTLFPHRKRFYTILMTESAPMYYIGRTGYHTLIKSQKGVKKTFRIAKRGAKKALNIRREDVYWTLGYGPLSMHFFNKRYYKQTIDWYRAQLQGERLQFTDQYAQLTDENKALLDASQKLNERIRQLKSDSKLEGEVRKKLKASIEQLQADNRRAAEALNAVNQQKSQEIQTLTERIRALESYNAELQANVNELEGTRQVLTAQRDSLTDRIEKDRARTEMLLNCRRKVMNMLRNRVDISPKKVSVIVPIYKREIFLPQCLDSLLHQSMQEAEFILVDKGEHDAARALIDHYVELDSRFKAPHIVNNGYGASANIGLDLAQGEYVMILESDDYLESTACEELYQYANEHDADVVKTPYISFVERDEDSAVRKLRREKSKYTFTNLVDNRVRVEEIRLKELDKKLPKDKFFSAKDYGELLEIHASLWSCIYKRAYLDSNDIRFVEADGAGYVDVLWRVQTLTETDKLMWLDKPFYHYRNESNVSSTDNWDLDAMLQRWYEVHLYFAEAPELYEDYYGVHLLVDEYLNTVHRQNYQVLTDAQRSCLARNLAFVPEKVVKTCSVLSEEQKKEINDAR